MIANTACVGFRRLPRRRDRSGASTLPRPPPARGQAFYASFSFGAGGALGGLLSGVAWGWASPGITFSASAAAALAGMLLVVWKLKLEH